MGQKNTIFLCVSVAILVVLGMVMLASTSVWVESDSELYHHVKRQSIWIVVGVGVAAFCASQDYRRLSPFIWFILAGACFLLLLCYVPGIGLERNGETRWIKFPGLGQVQPSEPAKIAVMMALAFWLSKFRSEVTRFWKGFVIPGCILGIPTLLIFFEKDMGTAAAIGGAGLLMLFVAGTRLRYLAPSTLLAFCALTYVVYSNANRWARIMAFIDLEESRLSYGLQQWRARLAFGSGGVSGLGLGNGSEKHGYLPFAHTDFIFAMIGEELGLMGTLLIVFCFVMIAVSGISIALNAPDHFGKLFGFGLTAIILVPAMMNMGVTTGMLPNTGLPLPFLSYGGSNLVFTLAAIGLLVSIHRQSVHQMKSVVPTIKDQKIPIKL